VDRRSIPSDLPSLQDETGPYIIELATKLHLYRAVFLW
jgi:hypothetical protein